jgi:hypothetical protein
MSTPASFNDLPNEILYEIYSHIKTPQRLMEIARININHSQLVQEGSWEHIKITMRDNEMLSNILTNYKFVNLSISDKCNNIIDYKPYLNRCKKLNLTNVNLDSIADCFKKCENLTVSGGSISKDASKYLSNIRVLKFRGTYLHRQLQFFVNCESLTLIDTDTETDYIFQFLKVAKKCHTFKSRFNFIEGWICDHLKKLKVVHLYSNNEDLKSFELKLLGNCEELNLANINLDFEILEHISKMKKCKYIKIGSMNENQNPYEYPSCFDGFEQVSFNEEYSDDYKDMFPKLSSKKYLNLDSIHIDEDDLDYFTECFKLKLCCNNYESKSSLLDEDLLKLKNVVHLGLSSATLKMETIDQLIACKKLKLINSKITGDYSSLIRLDKLVLNRGHNIPKEVINDLAKKGLNIKLELQG